MYRAAGGKSACLSITYERGGAKDKLKGEPPSASR